MGTPEVDILTGKAVGVPVCTVAHIHVVRMPDVDEAAGIDRTQAAGVSEAGRLRLQLRRKSPQVDQ